MLRRAVGNEVAGDRRVGRCARTPTPRRPRCAMPCTSGCFRCNPASTAAWSITQAIDSTPWPPTPHSTRSKFMPRATARACARGLSSLIVLGVGDAGAAGDDHRQPLVGHLLADDADVVGPSSARAGDDDADVLARHAQPGHQVDHLLVGGHRRLAAGHRDDAVVEDEDLDVDVLARRVEQRRHARVGERAVADHAQRRASCRRAPRRSPCRSTRPCTGRSGSPGAASGSPARSSRCRPSRARRRPARRCASLIAM